MASLALFERCSRYLAARTRTYEDRTERFRAAGAVLMWQLNLKPGDTIFDLGAGHCEFDFYLRHEARWMGRYVPIDGSIDGTDLQDWRPIVEPEFYLLMESLEHLDRPYELLDRLGPTKGIVLTTPNPEVVDVLAIDDDHRSSLWPKDLADRGFQIRRQSFFDKDDDTILAWKAAQ